MPNESKPEREECDAPETTPRNAPEAVVSAVAQSQGINPTSDSGGTLEKRLERIVEGPSAGVTQTPESELLRSQIKGEIAGVKPGTPVDRYLKGSQSEQQAVVEKLVNESMSGSPDAVGAFEDLSTIKKLECLGHLARSMGGNDPNSKRDRFDSLLTLSHMERADGETGGFAAQVLNQLFEKGPLSVQTEIITSRGVADIEQNHLQERSSNLLQDLFSGGGMEPLLKLEAYNRSRLLQGYGGLKDLTVFARDFQQTRGTFQDGASDLENLSKLAEKSAVTRKLMDELVSTGVLNFDESTGLYSSASNSEFNPAALWNVRYAANADSRDGYGQKLDHRPLAESDEIRAFRTLLDRELNGESTEQGAEPNNNRSDSSGPSESVVLSEDELQAQLDLIGLYARRRSTSESLNWIAGLFANSIRRSHRI